MPNVKVSVVVPVYKVEAYLNRCVESLLNQTHQNLEIILVDDGSPDNCPEMCENWAERDSRIRVVHKENDGLANARNSGLAVATGDYVMFADSDDYLESDMVEFLLRLLSEHNADVARCGFFYTMESGGEESASEDESVRVLGRDERIIDLAVSGFTGTAWNKLYNAALVKSHPYDKADGCSEDIMHNYRVYRDANRLVVCDVPKYHYVIRSNSTINTSRFGSGAFDIIRAKKIIMEGERDNAAVYPYAVRGFIKSAFIVLSGCIQHGKFPQEQQELIQDILSFKKTILSSSLYPRSDKMKTLLLSVSPKLYKKTILAIHKRRGA